jgi:hypothetical protein
LTVVASADEFTTARIYRGLGRDSEPTQLVSERPLENGILVISDSGVLPGSSYAYTAGLVDATGREVRSPLAFVTVPVDVSSLDEVLPNPSHGAFAIRFQSGSPTHARLRVFDVAGRCVGTLIDGPIPSGEHNSVWDPGGKSGVKSGLYLVVLDIGDKRFTRRLLLMQ